MPGLLSMAPLVAASFPIKHVIVLMLENRAFDHLLGWATDELGVDGLTGNEANPSDTMSTNPTWINVTKNAPFINVCDPCHGLPCTTDKIFGKKQVQSGDLANSSMMGFAEKEYKHKELCNVMDGFTPDKVPVTVALAKEFAIMDRFFCSVPGPTWPNRLFMLSATSAGSTETGTWYHNNVGHLFPQKTIFDQVEKANLTWRNYFNDTPWEMFMEKVAFSHEEVRPLQEFYNDAANGTLPAFGWINPSSGIDLETGLGSNDQHPDHDIRLGEALIKDLYEALRASPQWNETLFVVTYDEHGGFYDHVSPPSGVPPPGDGETSYPDKGFGFDRLGVRIPTLLISPWIQRGTVVSEPPKNMKPFNNSEYDLTSIMSTARKLLNMPPQPLTQRDAWAATFDHVITKLRGDTPAHLPEPVAPAPPGLHREAEAPINDLQGDLASAMARVNGLQQVPALRRQADFRPWMVEAFESHRERVRRWKQTPNMSLRVAARTAGGWAETAWDVMASASMRTQKMTVSTHKLRVEGVPLCLEADELTAGSLIDAKSCVPSADPDANVRSSQLWSHHTDATLRPMLAPELCLSALLYGPNETSSSPKLELCNGDVSQHWAYHGRAPGDGGRHTLEFGDDLNCLGLTSSESANMPTDVDAMECEPPNSKLYQYCYWFKGGWYWKWDAKNSKAMSGYPKPINGTSTWVGVPHDVDAVLVEPENSTYYGHYYFFKGSEYWKWDATTQKAVAGYPLKISENWKGMPDDIDATECEPVGSARHGYCYFIKGSQYWVWDASGHGKAMPGYPKPLASLWPGFPTDIDAILVEPDNGSQKGYYYIFKGDQYWKWDAVNRKAVPGYPRAISAGWPGPSSMQDFTVV